MYWKLFFSGGVDDDCDSVGDASWLVPGWGGANAHLRRWGEDEPLPSVDSRVDIRVFSFLLIADTGQRCHSTNGRTLLRFLLLFRFKDRPGQYEVPLLIC